jgi:hypothetical protein
MDRAPSGPGQARENAELVEIHDKFCLQREQLRS